MNLVFSLIKSKGGGELDLLVASIEDLVQTLFDGGDGFHWANAGYSAFGKQICSFAVLRGHGQDRATKPQIFEDLGSKSTLGAAAIYDQYQGIGFLHFDQGVMMGKLIKNRYSLLDAARLDFLMYFAIETAIEVDS